METKKVIRCIGEAHKSHEGNILMVVGKSAVFVKCNDRACKRWTKISLKIPGIRFNLLEAGIIQEVLPEGYHFDIEPAMTVVSSR